MAAPGSKSANDDKLARPPAGPSPAGSSSSRKNSVKKKYTAIFVGLFVTPTDQSFALFVNNCTNAQRLPSVINDFYYQAFAIAIPSNYSTGDLRFTVGLPYLFSSLLAKLDSDKSISLISCPFNEIVPLHPKDYHQVPNSPIIRGIFGDVRGKYCALRLTELPDVRFYSNPEVLVFLDQVSGRPGFLTGNEWVRCPP
jgi:hypothetical protein